MSNSREFYVCRFLLDNNKKFYFRSVWSADHFAIDVTDGRYVWRGEGNVVTITMECCGSPLVDCLRFECYCLVERFSERF